MHGDALSSDRKRAPLEVWSWGSTSCLAMIKLMPSVGMTIPVSWSAGPREVKAADVTCRYAQQHRYGI